MKTISENIKTELAPSCTYAVIYIDPEMGIMTAVTDCGNYAYNPPETNEDFIKLIKSISKESLLNKIAAKSKFSFEATKQAAMNLFDEEDDKNIAARIFDEYIAPKIKRTFGNVNTISVDDFECAICNIKCCSFGAHETLKSPKQKTLDIWNDINDNLYDIISYEYSPRAIRFADIFAAHVQPFEIIADDVTRLLLRFYR